MGGTPLKKRAAKTGKKIREEFEDFYCSIKTKIKFNYKQL